MSSQKAQEQAFVKGEADSWYDRNKEGMEKKADAMSDYVVEFLKEYKVSPQKSLDVGCSDGYRAAIIGNEFNCESHGIELSEKAVEEGQKKYPHIKLTTGLANDLSKYESASFDLVVIHGVYCLMDRVSLFQTNSEIDRVLKDDGVLVVGDFYPAYPQRVKWHHAPEDDIYVYKQDYSQMFTSAQIYSELGRKSVHLYGKESNHATEFRDRYVITLLKKNLYGAYLTQDQP